MPRLPYLNIENARIIFRNFSGKENTIAGRIVNAEGDRNFSVVIEDPDQALQLKKDGWNIKPLASRDEDAPPAFHLKVAVRFDNIPPKIISIVGGKQKPLTEETVSCLDYSEISNVDLTISPSYWEVNGNNGIKAYLKTMYVTIEEDRWAEKYAMDEEPFE